MPKPRPSSRNADRNFNLYNKRGGTMPYEMKGGKKMKMGEYGPKMVDMKYMHGGTNSIRERNAKRMGNGYGKMKSHNPGY